ncbi:MAG: hypothetical protein GW949_00935 [Spirochaetales bacterium]|nr:hypothetical protein [Spirochaetales bacterium]
MNTGRFRRYVAALVFFLLFSLLSAQTPPEISFSIQFYEQQMYFPGDDVQIRLSIKNESPEPFTFRLADNRLFNLEFDVVDLRNISQPPSQNFTMARTSVERVFYREVSLNPGEEFSFIEKLGLYRQISEGVYVVRAHFFPDLVGPQTMGRYTSNRLTLAIRPGFQEQQRVVLAAEQNIQQILQANPIPPDQVITTILQARMQSQRERFFLYLDVRSLYRMDPRRDSQFRRLSEQEQFKALQEFEEILWAPTIQNSISQIPLRYDILRTTYDQSNARVSVIQRYQMDSFVEVKLFEYNLSRVNGIWYVTSYIVNNQGTE